MTKLRLRILIIEDEPEISRFLEALLAGEGYDVETCREGREGLKACSARPPHLVVLDLGLPDTDGKRVIKSLREWSRIPIIILSAHHQESEKVEALELGADDYLTKPFGIAELLARIKVALRHAGRSSGSLEEIYRSVALTIDFQKRAVTLEAQQIRLTPTEYDLLFALARRAGQVMTQSELLREVWGKNSDEHDHYLRIYIQRLRQKIKDNPLSPKYIFTEPGVGYRLREAE